MFDEIPSPIGEKPGLGAIWWIAAMAALSFLLATLDIWKWLAFQHQDQALDALFQILFGIAFAFIYWQRRNAARYQDAMRKAQETKPPSSNPV